MDQFLNPKVIFSPFTHCYLYIKEHRYYTARAENYPSHSVKCQTAALIIRMEMQVALTDKNTVGQTKH